jgi:transcriptional regulator with XRE-family HTH domain
MPTPRRRSALAAARKASGHTQESLASALQVDRTAVARWETGERTPLPHLQTKLACLLGQSSAELRALITPETPSHGAGVESRLSADLSGALAWLDEHAGWPPGTSRRRVAAQLSHVGSYEIDARNSRRDKVSRSAAVSALREFYPDSPDYQVKCSGQDVRTGIVSQPQWLDLACTLTANGDRLTLSRSTVDDDVILDDVGARCALDRLVAAAVSGVRIVDAPAYRLLAIETAPNRIDGTVGLTPFVRYALTMDLLETELADGLARGGSCCSPDTLPLRRRYMPDLSSVFDLSGRLCMGGTLALCAFARPTDVYRGEPDFALVIQERSSLVLNAVRRLSVIPKGFHQPMTDINGDTRIMTTMLRKMEEELFGRSDVGNTTGEHRVAVPMHPSKLSEPMRWLLAEPGRLRMECTGFGLNLVSGNYEFAGLVVVEDEEFWARFGGDIEANWEATGLRLYSSRDPQTVAELIKDESWSSEGLFALLRGIRRLAETGGRRVNLPAIEYCGEK